MMSITAFKSIRSIILATLLAVWCSSLPTGNATTLTDVPPSKESTKWYNPEGKTDPFKPAVLANDTVVEAATLISFDTRDIRLVGTALGAELSALLMINNKGIIAKVGDKIGRNGGRIVSISKDRVVVRQPFFATSNNAKGAKNIQRRYEDTVIRVADSTATSTTQEKNATNTDINTNGLGLAPKSTVPHNPNAENPDESRPAQYDFSKNYSTPSAGDSTENR